MAQVSGLRLGADSLLLAYLSAAEAKSLYIMIGMWCPGGCCEEDVCVLSMCCCAVVSDWGLWRLFEVSELSRNGLVNDGVLLKSISMFTVVGSSWQHVHQLCG